MPRMPGGTKKTALTPIEQYELNQWLEQNDIHSNNLRRFFTDVLPLARLLSRHYPELIDLNYYPPKNSVHNKLCNWESFNKRVLSRLGVQLTREQMVRVARSIPGSVDLLLYSVMRVQLSNERKRRERQDASSTSSTSTEDDNPNPNAAQTTATAAPTATTTEQDQAEESAPASDSTHRTATGMPSMTQMTGTSAPRQAKPITGRKVRIVTRSPDSAAVTAGAGGGVSDVKRGELLHDNTQLSVPKLQQLLQLHESHHNHNNNNEHVHQLQLSPALQMPLSHPHPHPHPNRKSKRMILYTHYMQAVKQLQEKNDKIARIDQWSAHLENMLHLKCDRIDDLQKQMAQAKKRLKQAQESKKAQEAVAAAMKQKEQEEKEKGREKEQMERERERLRELEKERLMQELKEKDRELRERKEQEKEQKVATLLEKVLHTMKITEAKVTRAKTASPEEKKKTTTKGKTATIEPKTKTMPKTTARTTWAMMPKITPKTTIKTVPKTVTPKTPVPKTTTSKTIPKMTPKTMPKTTTKIMTKMTYSTLQPVKNLAKMFNAYRRQYLKQRRIIYRHNTKAKMPIPCIRAPAEAADGCGATLPRKLYEFL